MKFLIFQLKDILAIHPVWLIILEIIYVLLIIAVSIRIIWDTRSVSKTLAYLLLVIFVPIIGVIVYFSIGINYRKRKIYNKKLTKNEQEQLQLEQLIDKNTNALLAQDLPSINKNKGLILMLSRITYGHFNPMSNNNNVRLLQNGEQLFPVLKAAMLAAKHHIHIEFYIYEDDIIGNELCDIMIKKAQEGVAVRFIYDDFGSKGLKNKWFKGLKAAGVEVYPFNKIYLIALANRLNYRNHRKIVVIDGITSFVGGINVSDKYINDTKKESKDGSVYWRDTHLMIEGSSTNTLQHIFLSDWNFCSGQNITLSKDYFPDLPIIYDQQTAVQIVSSGPDSDVPAILNGILYAVNRAQHEICLTTPYYVPDEQLQQSLIIAVMSGVAVHLLVPASGDSFLVDVVAQSYYEELLRAGVRIYKYKKGFIHAKTFVIDECISSVGTANLDLRSFDLNFEVTAFIYDEQIGKQMRQTFFEDLADADEMVLDLWLKRSKFRKFKERFLRLMSPLM